jgi:integrase
MAKKRTGTIQPYTDARSLRLFRARIRLADGARPWLKVPEGYSEARAREWAAAMQEREDEQGKLLAKKLAATAPAKDGDRETCSHWFERYLEHRQALGQTSVRDDRYRWNVWIAPVIGSKPIARVTRDDVENVRDRLDQAILQYRAAGRGRGRISEKTAANVWGVLVSALSQACASKRRDLRVLASNPAEGVLPPERGGGKSKVYPYPSELLAILACAGIPQDWKELHVLACYTYLRPGELRVLQWSDVDFEANILRITKAWDNRNERVKSTKTAETRSVPIEPALRPLLVAAHDRALGKGLVAPLMSTTNEDEMALRLREHLRAAGCLRAALFADSATELPVRFRNWRDAGITWMAIRGDDPLKIRQRAGHKAFTTTEKYIREGENVAIAPGDVFPALPTSLWCSQRSTGVAVILHLPADANDSLCEGRELNPYRSYPTGT